MHLLSMDEIPEEIFDELKQLDCDWGLYGTMDEHTRSRRLQYILQTPIEEGVSIRTLNPLTFEEIEATSLSHYLAEVFLVRVNENNDKIEIRAVMKSDKIVAPHKNEDDDGSI